MDKLLKDLDLLIAVEGKLKFQKDDYDEAAATAYGIALLDFMRVHGVTLRGIVTASRAPAATVVGWRPIESAPKDGQLILLWGRYWSDHLGWMREPLVGQWIPHSERWEVFARCAFGIRPTVWQPLPPPPKTEGE